MAGDDDPEVGAAGGGQLPAAPPAAPPGVPPVVPIPPKFSPTAVLAALKENIAAVGTVAAGIAAVLTTFNTCSIDGMKRDIQAIDLRERGQKVTNDLTTAFFTNFTPNTEVKGKEKEMQAILSILDLNAQASADDGGWSEAEARKLIPLNMALLFGKPGSVAAFDPHYRYIDRWVGTALSDDDPHTSVTAIKALRGLCMRALSEGKLEVADQCSKAIDSLVNSIGAPPPEDPVFSLRLDAIAVRFQLVQGIKNRDEELKQLAEKNEGANDGILARICEGWQRVSSQKNKEEPAAVYVARLREYAANHEKDMQVVLEAKKQLEALRSAPGSTAKPPQDAAAETKALASANAAVSAASQGAVAAAVQAAEPKAPDGAAPAPLSGAARDQAVKNAVQIAIDNLGTNNLSVQNKAQTDLVLFGQQAVGPIVEKLAALSKPPATPDKDGVYCGKLARVLKLMQQPIRLTDDQAKTVAGLLKLPGPSASAMTDFFMDLWDEPTIQSIYTVLEENVEKTFLSITETSPSSETVALGRRSTLIVGTWARNLVPAISSKSGGGPMRDACLDKAKNWRKRSEDLSAKLQAANVVDKWEGVRSQLSYLINKADLLRKTEEAQDKAASAAATIAAIAAVAPASAPSAPTQYISIPVQQTTVPAPPPLPLPPASVPQTVP